MERRRIVQSPGSQEDTKTGARRAVLKVEDTDLSQGDKNYFQKLTATSRTLLQLDHSGRNTASAGWKNMSLSKPIFSKKIKNKSVLLY